MRDIKRAIIRTDIGWAIFTGLVAYGALAECIYLVILIILDVWNKLLGYMMLPVAIIPTIGYIFIELWMEIRRMYNKTI